MLHNRTEIRDPTHSAENNVPIDIRVRVDDVADTLGWSSLFGAMLMLVSKSALYESSEN